MKTPSLRPILCVFLTLFAGVALHAQREKLPPEDRDIVEQRWPEAQRTYTSLRYVIMQPGDTQGPSPKPGEMVSVVYKGMLLDGKIFDQNTADHPLKIRLARGDLIDGWEEALQKMHRGEKWLLIVPSEMAYGARGRPPEIKRNSTLVFEMELLDFGPDLK